MRSRDHLFIFLVGSASRKKYIFARGDGVAICQAAIRPRLGDAIYEIESIF